jgi:hypothetical protein
LSSGVLSLLNCSTLLTSTKPYPNSTAKNGVALNYFVRNNLQYNLDVYFINQTGFPVFIYTLKPTSSINVTSWYGATFVFNIQLLSQIMLVIVNNTNTTVLNTSSIQLAYCYNLLNDILIPKIDSSNNNNCTQLIAYKPYNFTSSLIKSISDDNNEDFNITILNSLNFNFDLYYIDYYGSIAFLGTIYKNTTNLIKGFFGASLLFYNKQLIQSIVAVMGNKYMPTNGMVLNITSIPTVYCYNFANDLPNSILPSTTPITLATSTKPITLTTLTKLTPSKILFPYS